jgi:CheY-like chemotaxis protein
MGCIIRCHGTENANFINRVSKGAVPASDRILIVDDDPSIRYLLSRILIDEGYQAVSAPSGCEGLKAVDAGRIDLVLLDLNMAGMTGQQVLKEMAVTHPRLPIVIITACPRQQVEAGLTGIAALLQKPLDFPVLLETIRKLLAHGKDGSPEARPPRAPLANGLML